MEVAAPTTAVEEAAVAEAAATRQGLGQVVEDPGAVRAVVLGDTTGEIVAAALGAVRVDAGMAHEAVPTTARQMVRAATSTVAAVTTTFAAARTLTAPGVVLSPFSAADSSADQGEVKVVAGIRQVTPSLVNY